MQKSGFRNGCPIATVLLELAPRERAVTEAGRKAYAARLAILSRKLVEDGFVKARADALAVLCTSALQGALIQARVERSGRPIKMTAAELARLLEAEAKS
jgi:TetR/AcrR family transcriptional regulator, lmrAB and yxaGH operons repressor